MLKILYGVPVSSRWAVAGGGSAAVAGCLPLLRHYFRILLCIICAILDRLALLEVVLLAPLDACQGLLHLAGRQRHLNLNIR